MKKGKILSYAFINSLSTAIYVMFIATFIYFLGQSNFETNYTLFVPIAMLMLLVFSVAITGCLIFGRPIIWYLDNKKKESLLLLFYTLEIFLIIIILIFLIIVLLSG